jgi:hypothetical protein
MLTSNRTLGFPLTDGLLKEMAADTSKGLINGKESSTYSDPVSFDETEKY